MYMYVVRIRMYEYLQYKQILYLRILEECVEEAREFAEEDPLQVVQVDAVQLALDASGELPEHARTRKALGVRFGAQLLQLVPRTLENVEKLEAKYTVY